MLGTRGVSLNSSVHNRFHQPVRSTQVVENLQNLDISVQIAEIVEKDQTLRVPSIVAKVIRDVIKEKTLPNGDAKNVSGEYNFTPYIFEPIFSGVDSTLHSSSNYCQIKEEGDDLSVRCVTTLGPCDDDIPIEIYLTGKEKPLPIEGQECVVNVKIGQDGKVRHMMGIVRNDKNGYPYVQLHNKGKPYETSNPDHFITFEINHIFKSKN